MEIFFLGTSAGLPSVTRGMPCIALRHNKHIILFDAGECCQKELMKAAIGFGSIRHIFISHLHLDHFLGIFGLIETLRLSTNISNETLNIYSPGNFEKLLINKWPFIKCNRLKEGYTVNFGDFDVKAFRVKHENEAFGFVIKEIDRIKFNEEKAEKLGIKGKMFKEILKKGKIKTEKREVKLDEISFIKKGRKIVYTGDTAYSDAIVKEAKDADVLIHEATFDESMQKEAEARKHSTVKDAALTAHKAGVKMLVLTHISSRYKKGEESLLLEQAKKYYKGKIIIAYDGLKIEI